MSGSRSPETALGPIDLRNVVFIPCTNSCCCQTCFSRRSLGHLPWPAVTREVGTLSRLAYLASVPSSSQLRETTNRSSGCQTVRFEYNIQRNLTNVRLTRFPFADHTEHSVLSGMLRSSFK